MLLNNSLENLTFVETSLDRHVKELAKLLAENILADGVLFSKFADRESVSEANYVAIQEAIQSIGLPRECKIVLEETGVISNQLHGITDNEGHEYVSLSATPSGTFIACTGKRYVDMTFRFPITEELKRYLPEMKSRYENIKAFRDAYEKGESPL